MDINLFYLAFIICYLPKCIDAVASLKEQLNHVARRASFSFDVNNADGIVGVPSLPNHLPEAEPILPGHTLIRPAMGMLKSAIKFPHRELEDGFGVDGNIANIGIRYDGRNERVMYSGFRRMPSDYIMVVPNKQEIRNGKPSFDISSIVIDMDNKRKVPNKILEKLKLLKRPAKKKLILYIVEPTKEEVSKKRKRIEKAEVYDILTPNHNKYLTRRRFFNIKPKNNTSKISDQRNHTKQEILLKKKLMNVRRENLHVKKLLNYMATNGLKDQLKKYNEIMKKEEEQKIRKIVTLTSKKERQFFPKPNVPEEEESAQIISTVLSDSYQSSIEFHKENEKMTWLLGTKHQFDDIKYDDDRPDFEEFVTKEPKNDFDDRKKQWWFFNQHDWKEPENGDEIIFQNPIYARK